MQILGKAVIRLGGVQIHTLPGTNLNTGGTTAEMVEGETTIPGFKEKLTACKLSLKLPIRSDLSIQSIRQFQGDIMFEGDNGKDFIIKDGKCLVCHELSVQDGSISAEFSGTSCSEIS